MTNATDVLVRVLNLHYALLDFSKYMLVLAGNLINFDSVSDGGI